jgi:hypothetical protein
VFRVGQGTDFLVNDSTLMSRARHGFLMTAAFDHTWTTQGKAEWAETDGTFFAFALAVIFKCVAGTQDSDLGFQVGFSTKSF